MTDVGINIFEGVAAGQSPYKEPSKRNIGLLGQFTRGASFTPTKIESMEEFDAVFGGQNNSFFGPAIVRSIFVEAKNSPVTLYIARVVGTGSEVADGLTTLTDDATMEVSASYKGSVDTGSWANGIVVTLYSYSSVVKDMFTLIVKYKDATEQYHGPTLTDIQKSVNKTSKYIMVSFSKEINKLVLKNLTGTVTAQLNTSEVTGIGTKFLTELSVGSTLYDSDGKVVGVVSSISTDTKLTLSGRPLVAVTSTAISKRDDKTYSVTLSGGADGAVSESDFYPVESSISPKGLACFDGADVQIIFCTEYHSLSMAKVLDQYLTKCKGPIGIINLPLNSDEGTAELYAMELQKSGVSYLAGAYLGWCKVPDSEGNPVLIPAAGPVIGAGYLRTPYLQGGYIHIPPAGVDSLLSNVIEVIPAGLSQPVINKLVSQFSCNFLQKLDNSGYYVGSSRSYSTDDLYSSIHIRLQTSYYVRALKSKLRFLEQKNNSPELKREALVELNRFFKTEWENGALERSVSFDTAYQGICDKSNNPPTQDRKLMNISCLYIPSECTEKIRIDLQRNDRVLLTLETE